MPALPTTQGASQPLQHIHTARNFRALLSRSVGAAHLNTPLEISKAFVARAVPSIVRRQVVPGIIPSYYQDQDGPAAATVVGITLGAVAGFLFICWLLAALCGATGQTNNIAAEEEIVVRKRAKTSSSSRRSRRSRHAEMRHYSRSPRRPSVIVDERRTSGPRRSSIIVEERIETRVPNDDIVEVIEEHSDSTPPRRKRHSRGYRSVNFNPLSV